MVAALVDGERNMQPASTSLTITPRAARWVRDNVGSHLETLGIDEYAPVIGWTVFRSNAPHAPPALGVGLIVRPDLLLHPMLKCSEPGLDIAHQIPEDVLAEHENCLVDLGADGLIFRSPDAGGGQ